MALAVNEPDLRMEVVEAMRDLARRGAGVRELVHCVHSSLHLQPDALLPVLWYFMKAFRAPLDEVLPVREWLGNGNDSEVDALILPAIRRRQAEWAGEPR